jgi:hypothetical protein
VNIGQQVGDGIVSVAQTQLICAMENHCTQPNPREGIYQRQTT